MKTILAVLLFSSQVFQPENDDRPYQKLQDGD